MKSIEKPKIKASEILVNIPLFLLEAWILQWVTTLFASAVPFGWPLAGEYALATSLIIVKDPLSQSSDKEIEHPLGKFLANFSLFALMYLIMLAGVWVFCGVFAWVPELIRALIVFGSGILYWYLISTGSSYGVPGALPSQEELVGKLRARVIGQEKAIDDLSLYTRGWLARKEGGKPLVVMLPGPTGTGKTELCKALAEALGTSLIRFDMGEFEDSHASTNLFGSATGYIGSEEGGRLPNAVRASDGVLVVLFDEVEKAYIGLWQQMLAFFDEGRVTDSLGTVTAPKNTICLMSTNLKSDEIGDNPEQAEDLLRESKHFSREFLGRVNKILPMPRLSPEDQIELSKLLVKRLGKEYEIQLSIGSEALEKLQELTAKAAYFGGGRGIAKELESMFLKDLLELRIAQWDKAQIKEEDGQLKMVGIPKK